jgi:glycerol-3-phosphate cytidylyltransferase-like family protein
MGGVRNRVDTRNKILTLEQIPKHGGLVTGYFDLLRVHHARDLECVRQRLPHVQLIAVVLQEPGELLNQRARAEMAAAMRMVDYVLIANSEDLDGILERLEPSEIVRLEAADLRRTRHLIEHVQRGQTR